MRELRRAFYGAPLLHRAPEPKLKPPDEAPRARWQNAGEVTETRRTRRKPPPLESMAAPRARSKLRLPTPKRAPQLFSAERCPENTLKAYHPRSVTPSSPRVTRPNDGLLDLVRRSKKIYGGRTSKKDISTSCHFDADRNEIQLPDAQQRPGARQTTGEASPQPRHRRL